jgi:hypothetical protein
VRSGEALLLPKLAHRIKTNDSARPRSGTGAASSVSTDRGLGRRERQETGRTPVVRPAVRAVLAEAPRTGTDPGPRLLDVLVRLGEAPAGIRARWDPDVGRSRRCAATRPSWLTTSSREPSSATTPPTAQLPMMCAMNEEGDDVGRLCDSVLCR